MNILYKAWINETGEKAPATVSIEPTIRCNMHCPMCDRTHKEDFRKHMEGEMSTELLLENIKILGEMGVKQILIIGGGEPLFRKDIVLLLKTIKQQGMICHLWTNGTLFTLENTPEILKNIDILTISLDSCYEDEHDKSRGIKGSYAHIMETLKMINKYREDTLLLRFHSVISKYNINRLDDMVDFAIEHGAGELGGAIINPFEFAPNDMLFNQNDQEMVNNKIRCLIEKANQNDIALAGCYNPIFDNKMKEYVSKYNLSKECKNPTTCFGLWSMSQIRPNGDVSICCFTYKPIIGNLHKHNFRELWNSPRAKEMRSLVKKGELLDSACKGCSLGKTELLNMTITCENADELLDQIALSSR